MDDMILAEAYRCLDLPPDAPPLQVERTYRRKRSLYAEESLATYALFDPGARQTHLARLETAYRRICGAARPMAQPVSGSLAREMPAPSPPDPSTSPGRFLRACREAAGLSLQEMAERTKIGSSSLRQIEEEAYGKLPSAVYLRGFILAYARVLGLSEPEGIARGYLDICRQQTGGN